MDIYDADGTKVVGDSETGRLNNAFTVFRSAPDSVFYVRVRSDEFDPTIDDSTGQFAVSLTRSRRRSTSTR